MDDPALAGGWWSAETAAGVPVRWTDGDAVISLPVAATTIEITCTPLDAYLLEAEPERQRRAG
jgi:hypothetical protein